MIAEKSLIIVLAVVVLMGMGCQTGNQIDHIIWAVPDLEVGAGMFEEMSGVRPAYGGVHPGRGTRNNLVSAGEGSYFEIIAPDPTQGPFDAEKEPVKAFASRIEKLEKPEVDMFVYSTNDLDAAAERGRELGLTVVGPVGGSRMTKEGFLLEWTHVDFIGHDFGQFVPFAINWGDMPHPSTTTPQGAVLVGVTVEHPRYVELGKIYKALGVPAKVVYGEEAVIIVRMKSAKGEFEVRSGPGLLEYYEGRSSKNIVGVDKGK
ncbi:MAG: VOC family protein [Planctomycetes bacterium]|nr:VOC family protein [Planctomycetota bacterium]